MKTRSRRALLLSGVVLAFLFLTGCATTGTAISSFPRGLLDFLEDGRTTRWITLEKLGRPFTPFENDRVHTYPIGRREGCGYFLLDSTAQTQANSGQYSLVLIFDEKGVLKKHALLSNR